MKPMDRFTALISTLTIPFLIITPPLDLVAEVIEDGGQVGLREGVGGVGDEETRLAHLPVPAHHALHRPHHR